MRWSHRLRLSFLLLAASDIETLALDTDDGDGGSSTGSPTDGNSSMGGSASSGNPTAETGDGGGSAADDPTAWTFDMAQRRCDALDRCSCPHQCGPYAWEQA